jgi:uncharacterized protein YukE
MVVFCVIDIFAFYPYPAPLLSTIIIAIIAFVLERVIEHTQLTRISSIPDEQIITNKAVFAYIDLYREVEHIHRDLIQKIAGSQSELLNQSELTHEKYHLVAERIDGYIQLQMIECQKLLEGRNKLEQLFSDLSSQTEQFCTTFEQYEEKLKKSNKSLLYYEKGTFLIEDINESFASRYKQTANEIITHLEDTEKQLRKVVDQYSRFNEHMRPFNEKINVYGVRMESAIHALQKGSESKQMILEDTSNKIVKALEELNDNMEKTLHDTDQFLQKNYFVLSKILETYRTNASTPRELKRILKSWQELSPAASGKE